MACWPRPTLIEQFSSFDVCSSHIAALRLYIIVINELILMFLSIQKCVLLIVHFDVCAVQNDVCVQSSYSSAEGETFHFNLSSRCERASIML